MEQAKLVELVQAVQQAKPNAATDLYNAFQKDLYFHIYKTINDPTLAEDLLQETFMEIFLKIRDLKEPAAFVSWSRQIAYSKCTAHFRKTQDILVDENEEGYSIFDTLEEDRTEFIPDEALDQEDLKQTVNEMINSLPPEQRSAILLHYFDELSIKDIAEIQGVNEGTVKSRLNYGRKSLKQAVENYEKKSGVKLRCVGIVPLLLWLLRAQAAKAGAAKTVVTTAATAAKVASTAATTTSTVAEVAADVAPAVAKAGLKTGAKAAGKFAAKKIAAAAIAATVAAGGVTTAVVLSQPEPQPPMVWTGCGEVYGYEHRTFALTVEEMDDEEICGHLEVSLWRDVIYVTDFSGSAAETEDDGKILYEIVLDVPIEASIGNDIEELKLEYNEEKDRFSFDRIYEVTMNRWDGEEPKLLAENARWSGIGDNSFHLGINKEGGHLFVMDVYRMTEAEISGNLTVSCADRVHHVTEFTGVGHVHNGVNVTYMLYFATPVKSIIDMDHLRIDYNLSTNTFETPSLQSYDVRLEQVPMEGPAPSQ